MFIDQPDGFIVALNEDKVYKLTKSLYGLKQALRAWYRWIDHYFLEHGFEKSQNEHILYIKKKVFYLFACTMMI